MSPEQSTPLTWGLWVRDWHCYGLKKYRKIVTNFFTWELTKTILHKCLISCIGDCYHIFNNEMLKLDFLKVARLLLFEWTWRERLLSLAARQIYRRNFPPVALSNQKQRYDSTRQSSQIITRSRAKLFEHTKPALR